MSYAFRPDQLTEPPEAKSYVFSQDHGFVYSDFPKECLSFVWIKGKLKESQNLADQIILGYKILRRKKFYFRAPNRLLSQLYKIIIRQAKREPEPRKNLAAAILVWKEHLWWVTVFNDLDAYLVKNGQPALLEIAKPDVLDKKLKNQIFRTIFISGNLQDTDGFIFMNNQAKNNLLVSKLHKITQAAVPDIKSLLKADSAKAGLFAYTKFLKTE